MKSQKGITLISLTVYVFVMIIVVGVIAVVTGTFMKSLKENDFYNDPIAEYTTFNSYFTEETNKKGVQITDCKDDYIIFDNNVQYSFIPENKGIYRNKVKICWDIDECKFSQTEENGKTIVTVEFKAGGQDKTTSYTIE